MRIHLGTRGPCRVHTADLKLSADDGRWTYLVYAAGATVPRTTSGLDLPVDAIYDAVTLDPDPTSGARAEC